jgi:hypothetical protein
VLVGTDQPQRREPPVAVLAAGANRGGDEHRDRQQQRHEHDHDQQREGRIQARRAAGRAEVVEPPHARALPEGVGARVEREVGRGEQPGGPDRADDATGEARGEQPPPVRRGEQVAQRRRDEHLAGARGAREPGREDGALEDPPAHVARAEPRVRVGDEHAARGGGAARVPRGRAELHVRAGQSA